MTARQAARAAAGLLVMTAALFLIGVAKEPTSESHEPSVSHEEGGHSEGHAHEAITPSATHHTSERKILGIDLESPAPVSVAVALSVVLAAGLWLDKYRTVTGVAVAFGLIFFVLDVLEVGHQLDEDRTGLAVLAVVIALGQLTASGFATLSGLRRQPTGVGT